MAPHAWHLQTQQVQAARRANVSSRSCRGQHTAYCTLLLWACLNPKAGACRVVRCQYSTAPGWHNTPCLSPAGAAWAGSTQSSFADQARKPGMSPETPQNGAPLRQHSPGSQQPQQQRSADRATTGGSRASRHKQAMPWVDTGAAVAGQYAEAREEARDHARLRNMYFQQVGLKMGAVHVPTSNKWQLHGAGAKLHLDNSRSRSGFGGHDFFISVSKLTGLQQERFQVSRCRAFPMVAAGVSCVGGAACRSAEVSGLGSLHMQLA